MGDATEPGGGQADNGFGRPSAARRLHEIYNPAELMRAIDQLRGQDSRGSVQGVGDICDDATAEFDPSSLTSEDVNRLKVLERIAGDPRGFRRRSIMGSSSMVRRLGALSAEMPHFAAAIDLVARAALVSARTATPLRLPPVLLRGQPGIGKSYTLRRLAEGISADFALIAANTTDAFRLKGLNTAWRGARMGRIAEIMLEAATTPVVLVDEFDKAISDRIEQPYGIWHTLLERENAEHFRDDFLEIELRADRIIWFVSANDVSPLPESIVDRFLVLEIPSPDQRQLRIIISSIYAACREAYGGTLPEHLTEAVSNELACHNPRRIGRILDLAVGYAAADGRRGVSLADVRCANKLAGDKRTSRSSFPGPVGFTP